MGEKIIFFARKREKRCIWGYKVLVYRVTREKTCIQNRVGGAVREFCDGFVKTHILE